MPCYDLLKLYFFFRKKKKFLVLLVELLTKEQFSAFDLFFKLSGSNSWLVLRRDKHKKFPSIYKYNKHLTTQTHHLHPQLPVIFLTILEPLSQKGTQISIINHQHNSKDSAMPSNTVTLEKTLSFAENKGQLLVTLISEREKKEGEVKRSCKDCKHELVNYDSLPDFLKHNEFVVNYYRSEWPLKQTILSIFSIHNETLNIWT